MMVTQMVLETVLLNELTRLIAREVFISDIASLNNLRGKNIEKFFLRLDIFMVTIQIEYCVESS
jgi:hypothetical protein